MINAIVSTFYNNLGIWLLLGFLVGIFGRSYSGVTIQFSFGLTLGILVVEIIRFLVYKG